MTKGEAIALAAMKKEHKSLAKKAALAKDKTGACLNAISTIINIRIQANDVLKSGKNNDEQMRLISILASKEKAALKVGKLSLTKLMDEEHELEFASNDLEREILNYEYYHK